MSDGGHIICDPSGRRLAYAFKPSLERALKLYPLFADLRGRAVLVIGGGAVAERKALALLAAGAEITLGAPRITAALRQRVKAGEIRWLAAQFDESWLDDAWLIVAATDNGDLHQRVAELARVKKIFINVVDDAQLSSFHVPALIDRSPLLIAISSGGDAPMLARLVRERLEGLLDHSLGALATLAGGLRKRIRSRWPTVEARRRFYELLFTGPVATALRRGQPAKARREAVRLLEAAMPTRQGSVVLVGAGPGDPGLLTLAGLRALNEADVILHDRLVSAEVLTLARRDAERIEVGKQAGQHHVSQARIHELLLEHARAGKRVVRLKGGDPFVFGRGGEELEYLAAHGIPFEVVPGITAALACAAYAGIPLTHRDHAQSVRLLTAHCQGAQDRLDWPALARERQTLAVYMGVAELAHLQRELLAHGRAADTPFALVEHGSRPQQRVIVGTLGELTTRARAYAVQSPALLILGEVAALAGSLAWFGHAPLGVPTRLLAEPEPVDAELPRQRILQAIHRG